MANDLTPSVLRTFPDPSILWNIYENMFPHERDGADTPDTMAGYLAMTKEDLARMLESARERLGNVLHGDPDA